MFGRKGGSQPEPVRCSFCNKDQGQVHRLIAGPAVNICDECVEVCNVIIADDRSSRPAGSPPERAAAEAPRLETALCALCRLPTFIEELLVVLNRGSLCPPCVSAIQAAASERPRTASGRKLADS